MPLCFRHFWYIDQGQTPPNRSGGRSIYVTTIFRSPPSSTEAIRIRSCISHKKNSLRLNSLRRSYWPAYSIDDLAERTKKMLIKKSVNDLAIFGGRPSFEEQLHVGRPNIGDKETLLRRIGEVVDRRWLTNSGPCLEEFERCLRQLLG